MMKATLVLREGQPAIIRVEGRLAGPWVGELERTWSEAAAEHGARKVRVELAGVSFVDEAGKQLLRRMSAAGTVLAAAGCLTRAIVEEVAEKPQSGERRPGTKGLACMVAAVLLFTGRIAAQPRTAAEATAPLKLTLHDAVALALRQNPEVQIGAIDLAKSEQSRTIARAALLPQASVEADERELRLNIAANFGRPFPGFPEHIGPFHVFEAGPAFSMPVFDLTLWRHWQGARDQVEESNASRQNVREQVTLLVVSQYLASLQAIANVKAARSRVELAQALYDQAADLQSHGVATGLDTLRANVELQNEQQGLIQAETAEKTALYGLARLLNVDPSRELELTDELSFYQTPPFEARQSIAQALENRPEIKAIDAQQMRLEAARSEARDQRLPSVQVEGSYLQQGLTPSTVIPTYTYELHVEMPIVTSGRIRAQEASANLDLARIAQQKLDLDDQIALEVKTAAAELESARHEVEVANQGLTLAQAEVQQARDRFQAGVANNIEVVTAQDALARANENQIGALYRYNVARADLARATGQMQNLYAK
jgi:outer membrane protein